MMVREAMPVLQLRLRRSWRQPFASGALALFMLVSMTVSAACKVSDIDQKQADRLAYDIDESRNRLETLALTEMPFNQSDALGSRLAWDEVGQTLADYATLKALAELQGKMKTAADRAVVTAEFTEMAGVTGKALNRVADYLVTFSSKAADAAIAMEIANMRDHMQAFTRLFVCTRTAQP